MMISACVIITVPRREFYDSWRSADNGKCVQTILASTLAKEGLEENDVTQVQAFKRTLSKYGADMYEYFRQYGGVSEIFSEECAWLDLSLSDGSSSAAKSSKCSPDDLRLCDCSKLYTNAHT